MHANAPNYSFRRTPIHRSRSTTNMPVPTHIDVFNKVVAKTMLLLYDNFPRPIDLDPVSIGLEIIWAEELDVESDQYKALVGTPESTIDFLANEGFIKYDPSLRTIGRLSFPEARLTAKGLLLLNQVPESVDESKDRRSRAERIKSATSTGIKTVAPEVIGALVSGLLKGG